jgi:hypothetical protein
MQPWDATMVLMLKLTSRHNVGFAKCVSRVSKAPRLTGRKLTLVSTAKQVKPVND